MLLSNFDLLTTAPGGVARLRELILTLAVQGKLVPQDPADEPASVLLKKIRAEKDRLITEGKIKRDKPSAEVADEEKPIELPQGWEWVRLGDVQIFTNGYAFKSVQFSDAGVGVVRIGNVHQGEITEAGMVYLPDTLAAEIDDQFFINPGDLVITMTGDVKLGFNRTSKQFLLNQRVGKIRPLLVSADYLVFCLTLVADQKIADASGSVIPNVSTGEINVTPFALPPLAEQFRIATRVEELMRLCDGLEAKGQLEARQHAQLVSTLLGRLTGSGTPEEFADNWGRVAQHFDLLLDRHEAIDALEQTLLKLAVRGLLVPQDVNDEPASTLLARIRTEKDRLIAEGKIKREKLWPPITDDEKPFELPVGWEWVRLGDVVQANTGFAFKSEQYTSGGTLVFRVTNIKPDGSADLYDVKYIDTASALATYKDFFLSEGDVLLVMVGGSLGKIGVVTRDCLPAVLNQNMWKMVNSNAVHRRYLVEVLRYVNAHQLRVTSSTHGHLAQGEYLRQVVALPPYPEQSRIVSRIESVRRLCAILRQQLADSQATQTDLAEALIAHSGFALAH